MRVYHFSEGAYPYLPAEDTYDSLRVSLPNSYYDPKKGAELLKWRIDEWACADENGLDLMINEHHQTPTCTTPASPLLAAVLARNTTKARILMLGNPIANRRQPVRVAEEMAMIDVYSEGRLECGFVKGVPYEVAPANSNPVRMNERMWEALDLIKKAWISHDGPFTFEGRYFHHRCVNIWPRPYQDPHPPIWVSATSPGSAKTIGEKGYSLGTFNTGYADTPAVFTAYREGWAKGGRTGHCPIEQIGYAGLVHVAETEEAAREGGKQLLWYYEHNKVPLHYRNPPGYVSPQANAMALKTGKTGNRPDVLTVDELVKRGILFCGTPDQVFEQIKKFYLHVGGFGHLIAMGQAGFLSNAATKSHLKLFAKEVLPRLQDLPRETANAA
ncbi:MAG: LLM class flavin-dependent oxidoreductase [Rhizobiaceae bacterium]|nr:LLM class flavin-dependent oxidoreductase [Rhizobiaceae bacterium]